MSICSTAKSCALKRGEYNSDWTYVSPPLEIKAGPRTGTFRLGTDQLLAPLMAQAASPKPTSPSRLLMPWSR